MDNDDQDMTLAIPDEETNLITLYFTLLIILFSKSRPFSFLSLVKKFVFYMAFWRQKSKVLRRSKSRLTNDIKMPIIS